MRTLAGDDNVAVAADNYGDTAAPAATNAGAAMLMTALMMDSKFTPKRVSNASYGMRVRAGCAPRSPCLRKRVWRTYAPPTSAATSSGISKANSPP